MWVRYTWDLRATDLTAPFPSAYSQATADSAQKGIILEIVIASYASDPVWSTAIADVDRQRVTPLRSVSGPRSTIFC